MLAISHLYIQRGRGSDAHAVSLPHLHLQQGQIMAIVGASGCGKSTLLESLGLLLRPNSLQQYSLDGQELSNWGRLSESHIARLRAQKIGFMLQSGGLIPYLSVLDNIHLPRKILGKKGSAEHISYAMEKLELTGLGKKLPAMLSIGERQRVAFVRAIAHEPALLLADEPTAALDPHNAHKVFELFIKIVEDLHLSALIVSHDWDLVEHFHLATLKGVVSPGECRFV